MLKDRIRYIDLARGFAVLFMVMVHVLLELCKENVSQTHFGKVIEFLGGPPAAPVFMFLMGTSLILSQRFQLKNGVIRGLKILFLGYLLNFCRGTLPVLIGLKLNILTIEEISPYTPASLFWLVDILQFAGLALIILSILRHLNLNRYVYLLIAGIIAVLSPMLWGKVPDFPLLEQIFTLMWGTGGETVAFPLFPWLFYPICGLVYGIFLKETDNRDKFLKRSAFVGLIAVIVGSLVVLTNYKFHIGDYWRTGPGGLLWISGFVLVFLWICSYLVNCFGSSKIFSILYFWSNKVIAFYFIHWILIGWLSFIEIQTVGLAIVMIFFILVMADLLTRLWSKRFA